MQCEHCGGTLRLVHGQDHYECEFCSTLTFLHQPEVSDDGVRVADSGTSFSCPVCPDSTLVVGWIDKTQVAFCSQCRGFVIDSESLGHLVQAKRAAYRGPDQRPIPVQARELDVRRRCPACQQFMQTHPYYGPGNSVIDSCVHCLLTWIDHGELDRIIRAPGLRCGGGYRGGLRAAVEPLPAAEPPRDGTPT